MRVCDKLNRGSDKLIVQYSNVGPELYAVCHIWRVHFYIKLLSKIGFYHSGVLRWLLFGGFGGIQQHPRLQPCAQRVTTAHYLEFAGFVVIHQPVAAYPKHRAWGVSVRTGRSQQETGAFGEC